MSMFIKCDACGTEHGAGVDGACVRIAVTIHVSGHAPVQVQGDVCNTAGCKDRFAVESWPRVLEGQRACNNKPPKPSLSR